MAPNVATGWAFLGGMVLGVLVVIDALRRQPGRWILFVRLVAVAHVAIVAELAFFPLPVDATLVADLRAQAAGADPVALNVSLVPWATIGPSVHRLLALRLDTPEVRNLLGNLVLLVPMAWYGPNLWPRLRNLFWFAVTAIGFSVTIELLQLAITLDLGYSHATDVDDVILNASGATLAFVVQWAFRRRRRQPRKLESTSTR